MINAVLRRVSDRSRDAWFDELSQGLDDHDRLALRTAHPRWIVDAYADLLEPSELEQALSREQSQPLMSALAIRPGLAAVSDLLHAGAHPSQFSPFGARWRGDPADLQLIRDGRAGSQDEGSQLVTWALDQAAAAPSGWWLDVCALGPGGKSALLEGLARLDGQPPARIGSGTTSAQAWRPPRRTRISCRATQQSDRRCSRWYATCMAG